MEQMNNGNTRVTNLTQPQKPLVQPDNKQIIPKENKEELTTEKEVQKRFMNIVKNENNPTDKSIIEQGKDLLNIASMSNLMTNEEFIKDFQEVQRKQIIDDLKEQGKVDAIKKQAEKQTTRNLRNDSFYNAFQPFFKNFMGIEKAFGLIPMLITVVIFYTPYLLISLIITIAEYVFKGINKIFSAIMEFKKPAKALCLIVVYLVLSIAIILALIYGIQTIFKFKLI